MLIIKSVLPIAMTVIFIFYYIKYKNKVEFFSYMYIALIPYFSANFSVPIYRQLLQIIVIMGFSKIVFLFLSKRKKIVLNKYELLFLLTIMMSGINASYNSLFISGITNFTFILIALILVRSTTNEENIKIYLSAITTNGVILSTFALLEFVLLNTRSEVVYSNPNYLGFYLVLSLTIYVFMFKSKSINYKDILTIVIFTLGIISTSSSSAIIGLIAVFIISSKINFKKIFKFIPVGIVTFLLIFYWSKAFLLQDFAHKLSESNAQRIGVWSLAIDGFLEYPIFGVGYNNFPEYFMNNKYGYSDFSFLSTFFQYDFLVTHNDFLRILSETGLIGLLIFTLYIKKVISLSIKIKEIHIRKMCLSLIVVVLFFISTHNNINSFDTWWIIGIVLYYTNNSVLVSIK
ncbi:O-antigen ligase family protein [Bacillus sp. DJP31]|uniref:O-antigen ligase family protein n=1 Tax=Bacillus sp. DJP31 TaxID=3409789 RepID=UPI003BB48EF8